MSVIAKIAENRIKDIDSELKSLREVEHKISLLREERTELFIDYCKIQAFNEGRASATQTSPVAREARLNAIAERLSAAT